MIIIDFERAQESMREITNLIDVGLVHVPPSMCFRLKMLHKRIGQSRQATSAENWSSKLLILTLDRMSRRFRQRIDVLKPKSIHTG